MDFEKDYYKLLDGPKRTETMMATSVKKQEKGRRSCDLSRNSSGGKGTNGGEKIEMMMLFSQGTFDAGVLHNSTSRVLDVSDVVLIRLTCGYYMLPEDLRLRGSEG